MTKQSEDLNLIHDEYRRFKAEFKSVLLTTISCHGVPDSSYEDYVRHDEDYYIYASELAQHTRNLIDTGSVSMLFVEGGRLDNRNPEHKRVVLKSRAIRVDRTSNRFKKVLQLFQQRFSDFPRILKSLPDFHLFRITPVNGAYVRGFGQAYLLDGDHLLQSEGTCNRGCGESGPSAKWEREKRVLQ